MFKICQDNRGMESRYKKHTYKVKRIQDYNPTLNFSRNFPDRDKSEDRVWKKHAQRS